MTPEEFRRLGHQVVDWLADYHAGLAERPVMSRVEPGEIKAALPAAAPEEPEPLERVIAELERAIVPGLSHWQHPRFFGYFPSNATLESVLGDFLSSGLGVLGLSWQSSPAVTELEEVVTDWMRGLLGLSPSFSGVIQDTASSGALVALICARERTTRFGLQRAGLQGEERPLVVYLTRQAHSSVEKAALLAGFGRENLHLIEHGPDHAMRPEALAQAVEEDLARGRAPCAVVATVGTTTSTAIDPLEPIAAIAQRRGLWLHVDAALGGSAMILPECRPLWKGADSLVVNAHKWLGAVFDCSLYFVRDPEHLVRVMSTNPSYLQSSADGRVKNLRDWGLPLGRRFRSLKLWLLLRGQGARALRERLRRDIGNARWLADQVRAAEGWRVLAPVPFQTVCVRHEPPGLSGEALDQHTREWAERVNRSGGAYLTPATLDERWMVRVSVGALRTERSDVEALWALMRREAAASR